MRRSAWALVALWGCQGFSPASAYVGTTRENAQASIDVGPGARPGEIIVNTWRTDRPKGDVRVTVERLDDRRLRVALPGCGLVLDRQPEPNDHQASVTAAPMQVCDVEVDHYKGPVMVGGQASFDKDRRMLTLTLSGSSPPSSAARVTWSLTYEGVAAGK